MNIYPSHYRQWCFNLEFRWACAATRGVSRNIFSLVGVDNVCLSKSLFCIAGWIEDCCICFRLSHIKEASQSCTLSVVELMWEAEGSLQATRHVRVPAVHSIVSVLLLPAALSKNSSYLYHLPAVGLFIPKVCFWLCLQMCVCVPVLMRMCVKAITCNWNWN